MEKINNVVNSKDRRKKTGNKKQPGPSIVKKPGNKTKFFGRCLGIFANVFSSSGDWFGPEGRQQP